MPVGDLRRQLQGLEVESKLPAPMERARLLRDHDRAAQLRPLRQHELFVR